MLVSVVILSLLTFRYVLSSYPFNYFEDTYKRYPDDCCQLEWEEIRLGEELPKDSVIAGTFSKKKWAYMRDHDPHWNTNGTAVKSEDVNQKPHLLGHATYERSTIYPILVNPNRCIMGWYTTKSHGEKLPKNDHWFIPTHQQSEFGEFSKRRSTPGRILPDGSFISMFTLNSGITWQEKNGAGVDVLYVDCFKSLQKMSSAKFYNISYNNSDVERVIKDSQKVTHVRKRMKNSSPMIQEDMIKFSIHTSNNASIRFNNTIGMVSRIKNVRKSRGYNSLNRLFSKVGVEVSDGDDISSRYQRIFEELEERTHVFSSNMDVFEFSQNFKLPPNSVTTVEAFSHPHKGQIPFQVAYEVTPSGSHTPDMVIAAFRKFGFREKIERTTETLQIYIEGIVDVETGHQVHVSIETTPL